MDVGIAAVFLFLFLSTGYGLKNDIVDDDVLDMLQETDNLKEEMKEDHLADPHIGPHSGITDHFTWWSDHFTWWTTTSYPVLTSTESFTPTFITDTSSLSETPSSTSSSMSSSMSSSTSSSMSSSTSSFTSSSMSSSTSVADSSAYPSCSY